MNQLDLLWEYQQADMEAERQENTNGIGFFFTKDFNTLRDLFKKERQ